MRPSAYALSVALLVAEYVRRARARDAPEDAQAPRVPSAALAALVRFLGAEIQRPQGGDDPDVPVTSLVALINRLERALDDADAFHVLSGALVGALAAIDSPEAVDSAVDRIAECVAPLDVVTADGGSVQDPTSTVLARDSVLGVFVRKFLLSTNRLLFDGLSALFDDVQRYVEQFREDSSRERRGSSQFTWNEEASGELLLSPIREGSSSMADTTPVSSASASPPLISFQSPDPTMSLAVRKQPEQVVVSGVAMEDAALFSSEQLDVILNESMQWVRKAAGPGGSVATTDPSSELPYSVQVAQAIATSVGASNHNALYAKYLYHLHTRDYQGALHALHQYHDATPADISRSRAQLSGATGSLSPHYRGSGIQYAALNLAGLHIVFDHYDAAHESLVEAIRVAQHHGDHICVAFALSWMIRVAQKRGKPKADVLPLVKSCIDRAKELVLPTLSVLSAIAEVDIELTRGGQEPSFEQTSPTSTGSQLLPHLLVAQAPGPRPAEIWQQLDRSASEVVSMVESSAMSRTSGATTAAGRNGAAMLQLAQQQAAQAGSGGNSGAGISRGGMAWMQSSDAVLDTMWEMRSQVHLSSAVAWRLFGNMSLDQVFSQIFVTSYKDVASLSEIAAVIGRMALHCLIRVDGETHAPIYSRAIEHILDAVGVGDSAELLIRQPSLQRVVHYLFFLWAMRKGQYSLASYHLYVLEHLSPATSDLPAHIEAQLARATLNLQIGDYDQCIDLLEVIEEKCAHLELAYALAQALLIAGEVRVKACAPSASTGTALPPILKCIDICKRHGYDLLLAEAHLLMAEVLLSMGCAGDARALVRDEMSLISEHGTVHLRAEALLLLAKCEFSLSGERSATSKIASLLDESMHLFKLSQDVERLKETSYLTALVSDHALQVGSDGIDEAQMIERRETAAKQFLAFQKQLNDAKFQAIERSVEFGSVDELRNAVLTRMKE